MESSHGVHFAGQHDDPTRFIRELRRMMPGNLYRRQAQKPTAPEPVPSEALTALQSDIEAATHLPSTGKPVSCYRALEAAARGENFRPSVMAHNIIPDVPHHVVDKYRKSVYGGRFVGEEGERFVTSCQDYVLRAYDTGKSECESGWKQTHSIDAYGVRWTITDFDVSPNGRWLAYTSLNRYVHLADLENRNKSQVVLDLGAGVGFSVNIWSLKWSHDGNEIIVGTGGSRTSCYGNIIVYDVQVGKIVEVIAAHQEDVNSVCFMRSGERNLILSASDDALVKLWDRRDMSTRIGSRRAEAHIPCGVFVGHRLGLTFVSTKDDGKYLISNGKDQFIKLWDARKCGSESEGSEKRMPPRDLSFDYRVQHCPIVSSGDGKYRDDSVMTYGGEHETLQTLIRAYFSPGHSTGQKYIYCGSSDGRCAIYDVVSGKAVRTLGGHRVAVRDVSWHPYGCSLTTSSFDGRVLLWSKSGRGGRDEEEEGEIGMRRRDGRWGGGDEEEEL